MVERMISASGRASGRRHVTPRRRASSAPATGSRGTGSLRRGNPSRNSASDDEPVRRTGHAHSLPRNRFRIDDGQDPQTRDGHPVIAGPVQSDSLSSAQRATDKTHLDADVRQSVRNAAKLGSSLLLTWAIALGVRIFLPRHLGPNVFGEYQFADSFTTTLFVMTGLGIETYIRKEVSTRLEHANDFFGGMLLVRVALSAFVMLGALLFIGHSGKPTIVWRLVAILGSAQILTNVSLNFAALLHSAGTVSGLSVLNVVSKLVWGVGIFVTLTLGGGVQSIAWTFLLAESIRFTGLLYLSFHNVGVRLRIDMRATRAVIVASAPYYVGALAQTIYSGTDISIMSFLTNDREVGWYGAASNLAGMALLLSPLIIWVLLPLTSRAAARSEEELNAVSRRSMELILIIAFPISLFLYLGAETIILIAFGQAFEPAVRSLRVLAPLFVLTYAAMVSATVLIRLERGWSVTSIAIGGMFISVVLNLLLIPHFAATLGPGGAGVGASITLIVTEIVTTGAMTWTLGSRAFDRQSLIVLSKTCVVCAVTIVADRLLMPLGRWRFLPDVLLYLVAVIAWGALDLRQILATVRGAFQRSVVAAEPAIEAVP
jgi:O-antigen/teichoic acid export membrane protein